MIALGNALSSFPGKNLLGSCRKGNGIPRNFALYSNSYRAARETLVFHASSTCTPPSLPSPLPLMRSQFRFAGINPSNWRKRPFDSIEHPSFHLAGKNETIRNVTNIVALYREIKLEIRRIPFLRSPRSSLWNPVRRPGRVYKPVSCISYTKHPPKWDKDQAGRRAVSEGRGGRWRANYP